MKLRRAHTAWDVYTQFGMWRVADKAKATREPEIRPSNRDFSPLLSDISQTPRCRLQNRDDDDLYDALSIALLCTLSTYSRVREKVMRMD